MSRRGLDDRQLTYEPAGFTAPGSPVWPDRLSGFRCFEQTVPVCVVEIVDEADRCGFAYGTLEGHPVSGEEAFVLHRDREGAVWFTLRSAVRPAPGGWRLVFPLILVAQRVYRRRYLRTLVARPRP